MPHQEDSSPDNRGAIRQIAREIDGLVGHLDSLGDTLPILVGGMSIIGRDQRRELEEYEKDNAMHVEKTEEVRTVTLTSETFAPYKRLMKRLETTDRAVVLLPEIFVVALVSQYDAFLGGLVRALMSGRPEIVNATSRSISFAQLVEFDSIRTARDAVINEEVETLLRKSHSEQFSWLESTFNVKLREGLRQWPDFVELTERRNLFVHARGIVSRQYLEVCRRHQVPVGKDVSLGKRLHVPPEYFARAHGCVLEIGVMLGHVLWRKVFPDYLLDADRHLNGVCYELLVERRYDLAATLLDFAACTLKKFGSEEYRRIMVINRAQAYKWRGDRDGCENILGREDWSASQDSFKLANAVLGDNVEASVEIMRRIGATHDVVTKESYRDWPLFREIRKEILFQDTYKELFGEPLEMVKVKAGSEEHDGLRTEASTEGEGGDARNEAAEAVH